jgi:hypothetical protein
MHVFTLGYKLLTFGRSSEGPDFGREGYWMMKPDEKTRPKWCNDKLKRAKGTTGASPVRRPSGAGEDTFDRAMEFPDDGTDRSGGKGSCGAKAQVRIKLVPQTGEAGV